MPSSSLYGVCSLILLPLFATAVIDTGGKFAAGVVDTGGNLPPASLTPVANLPPVSTTLAKMVEKFATGMANLPPVSLIPVVHLDANISANFRRNSKRSNWNTLGLGETDA